MAASLICSTSPATSLCRGTIHRRKPSSRSGQQLRRDRTEGQTVSSTWPSKSRYPNQLWSRFSDLSLPILALGGYASQTYVDQIKRSVARGDREAVLVYAGDHDASGDDIYRDFGNAPAAGWSLTG